MIPLCFHFVNVQLRRRDCTVWSDDTVQPSATKVFNSERPRCSTTPTYSFAQFLPCNELFQAFSLLILRFVALKCLSRLGRGDGSYWTRTSDPRDVNTMLSAGGRNYRNQNITRNASNPLKYWAFSHAHGCAFSACTLCAFWLCTPCASQFAHRVQGASVQLLAQRFRIYAPEKGSFYGTSQLISSASCVRFPACTRGLHTLLYTGCAGVCAQLVARNVRIVEVRGSNPLCSMQ